MNVSWPPDFYAMIFLDHTHNQPLASISNHGPRASKMNTPHWLARTPGPWSIGNHTWKSSECMCLFQYKPSSPKIFIFAIGSRQKHGIDFGETYAPVLQLLISTHRPCPSRLERPETASNGFLHRISSRRHMSGYIYMRVPDGFFNPSQPHLVWKFQKSLYGLKQSPRLWH